MEATNTMGMNYETVSMALAVLFILIVVILLLYMTTKEKESSKKIIQLEASIEDVNKEIYKIQKWIKENDKKIQEPKQNTDNLKALADMKTEIISLQHGLQSDREYFEDKLLVLEERLRGLGHFNSASAQRNEQEILELFKSGHTIDVISKKLRITKSEVEFVLKLSEMDSKGEKHELRASN